MKPETVKAIFTNLLFVIGVVLMVVGFIQGTRTIVKLVVFPKYPLDSWEESKCDQAPYAIPAPVASDKTQPPPELDAKVRQNCLVGLENERGVKLTEDIVGSVSMLVSGGVLIYFFRKYILK